MKIRGRKNFLTDEYLVFFPFPFLFVTRFKSFANILTENSQFVQIDNIFPIKWVLVLYIWDEQYGNKNEGRIKEIAREMEVKTEFWKKFMITFEYFAIIFNFYM